MNRPYVRIVLAMMLFVEWLWAIGYGAIVILGEIAFSALTPASVARGVLISLFFFVMLVTLPFAVVGFLWPGRPFARKHAAIVRAAIFTVAFGNALGALDAARGLPAGAGTDPLDAVGGALILLVAAVTVPACVLYQRRFSIAAEGDEASNGSGVT